LQSFLDKKEISAAIKIHNNEQVYSISSRNYLDINSKNIGKLNVLINKTQEYSFVYDLILKISSIVLFLLFILFIYYTKYIQNTQDELNQAYDKIQKMAIIDTMTTLFNKNCYLSKASKQIQRSSRNNNYLSFILIDVDNFKQYNDNYGHLKGDEVLKAIALCMKQTFKRATDCSYRVGGEEFLIIVEHKNKDNAFNRAKVLCKEINDLNIRHEYNNNFHKLTVSIGVYSLKSSKITKKDICYEKADKALYMSKTNGKNQVTLFQEDRII
jgi:diguanylate cyclase (GGDEF)-like protein